MSFKTDFSKDKRRQQELRMRPLADRVYIHWLGDCEIMRYEAEDEYLLDQSFAIDVTIRLHNGMILTGQEKFLSYEYARFNSLTVEYLQNQFTGETGDWFRLSPQFYFCAYCNAEQTGFIRGVIVDWPMLALATLSDEVIWHQNKNKNGRARASFRYVNFNDIPQRCILYSFQD